MNSFCIIFKFQIRTNFFNKNKNILTKTIPHKSNIFTRPPIIKTKNAQKKIRTPNPNTTRSRTPEKNLHNNCAKRARERARHTIPRRCLERLLRSADCTCRGRSPRAPQAPIKPPRSAPRLRATPLVQVRRSAPGPFALRRSLTRGAAHVPPPTPGTPSSPKTDTLSVLEGPHFDHGGSFL